FLNGDVPPALAKRDDQLDLELEIRCERRIRNARAIEHDRIARLLEEERRISLVGLLHLFDVIEIVAADAIDAAHRKRAAARDGGNGRRNCRQSGTSVVISSGPDTSRES